jgi:glyoxylase-like metal-dependent hydrolase (beta-lactamase superfamily II)
MGSQVRKISLLDFGIISAEPGWFIPNPNLYSMRGKVGELEKQHKWFDNLSISGAVVEHKDGTVLIDTGVNPEAKKVWPKSSWEAFPVTKFTEENRLENQLKLIGLKLEDINFVVFTHLHLDHAGQAFLFSNLKTPLVVHKKELMYAAYLMWLGKTGAYVPQDLEPLKGAPWYTFDGEHIELLPGIELIHVGGHTPGSIMVKTTTDTGNTYIFTGDLVHLPDELEVESKGWLLGNADEYLTSLRKLKLLARCPNTNLVISHDPQLWNKYPKAPKHLK